MPWARLDEALHQHPKVVGLSDRAFRLFICSITWSNANLTDGRLPPLDTPKMRHFVALLGAPSTRMLRKATEELVESGLWEPAPDGAHQIHDYLKYQPSKDYVERERELARERQRRRRLKAEESPDSHGDQAVTPTVSPPVTPSVTPTVSHGGSSEPRPYRPEDLGSESHVGLDPEGGSGGEPDVINQPSIEDRIRERFAAFTTPDQLHLWLKICTVNRAFAEIWPQTFWPLREQHGDPTLTEALRRLVLAVPQNVSHPRAYLEQIVAETAQISATSPSDDVVVLSRSSTKKDTKTDAEMATKVAGKE